MLILNKTNQMHISFKITKFILLYAARHVSDTTVSIIRSFLLLHTQSLVTYQITNSICLQIMCGYATMYNLFYTLVKICFYWYILYN
jgi:hypothetical protein